jgi:hypothetical protein
MNNLGKIGRGALWFAPVVIIPVGFFASLPWLNQQNDAIELGVIAAFAILLMGYSIFLAERVNRRLDEVQIAGQRFATTKGMMIGTGVAALVMLLSMDALVDLANTIGPALGSSPDKPVKLGIVFGYMLVVVFQLLGTIAVSIWWERRTYGERA